MTRSLDRGPRRHSGEEWSCSRSEIENTRRNTHGTSEIPEGRRADRRGGRDERVGAFDSFDEVASGNAQAYIAADYYWKGKHPGWAYLHLGAVRHDLCEWNAWIKFGGGQALWDELAAGFGLKCLLAAATGTQMGGWFNKEIETADDLKGLKMRIPGLGGDVMAKLGASPVSLPGRPDLREPGLRRRSTPPSGSARTTTTS